MKQSSKRYKCRKCGHETTQTTNHYGSTYSWGHFNCCEKCPPHAKYPEFGGSTIWDCCEQPPEDEIVVVIAGIEPTPAERVSEQVVWPLVEPCRIHHVG